MASEPVRLAFFHTELSRDGPGVLLRDILSGEDAQVQSVVGVVKAVQPDVLVLAGIDWDLDGHALGALADQIGGYPHRFAARPNRGIDSGADLNRDGRQGGPEDAFGFAEFPGQKGLAIISKLPFDLSGWRDFSRVRWREMPATLTPEDAAESERLSTTAHWHMPVILPGGQRLNLLVWHATAPVFDGPQDRNGRRNHDETAFWLHYLDGAFGPPPTDFVIMGAANLDPADGDGRPDALIALLADPRVQDPRPSSEGGIIADNEDAGANMTQKGDPALDTVDWPDNAGRPGNMRVDYVLPASDLTVTNAGVLWPRPGELHSSEVEAASRHRLVWVDIASAAE